MTVMSQIKATGHFNDVCAVNVLAKIGKRDQSGDGQVYQKLEVQMNSLSNSNALVQQEVNQPNYQMISGYVQSKKYLEIIDFDDHFECMSNDWTNKTLIKE